MGRLRVALGQLNTVVGDLEGNVGLIIGALKQAEDLGVDLVAFPELAITGYPPEDLLLKPAFVADNVAALARIAEHTGQCAAVVGFVDVVGPKTFPEAVVSTSGLGAVVSEAAIRGQERKLRNAAAICARGEVIGVYHKRLLPNYGVFDEDRWFGPGSNQLRIYRVAGVDVGVSICEDLWFAEGPVAQMARQGARLIVNINASPYFVGRNSDRRDVIDARVRESRCAVAYVNQVGGQDELVFDGGSAIVDEKGRAVAAAPQFEETMLVADLEFEDKSDAGGDAGSRAVVQVSSGPRDSTPVAPPRLPQAMSEEAEIYSALVLGTRDYLHKNGFRDAVIGLSGGIDSSLVAVVAVDALGAEHVHGVAMPGRYSSPGSRTDAAELAGNLGIEFSEIPIDEAHEVYARLLEPRLGEPPRGLADENLQSRLRGVLLMALSNANGWIVLTTGNKSELATGYSTLYGDSAGGFAVIKDVPKTLVYRLCRHRNSREPEPVIPRAILQKAPSAELRPDQRDDQSLPPYEVLDPILKGLVNDDRSIVEVVAEGFDPELVTRVAHLVDVAEYKRRQSPPGVRISPKAFGKDRRMPITNSYVDRSIPSAPASAGHPETGQSGPENSGGPSPADRAGRA